MADVEQNVNEGVAETPEVVEGEGNVASSAELEGLRAQLARSEAEKAAATEIAQRYAQEAQEAQKRVQEAVDHRFHAEDVAIANALAAAQNDAAAAKAEIARLSADGKFDEAAEATDRLTDAKVRLRQAEGRRSWIEGEKQKSKEQIEQYQERQRAQAEQIPQQPQISARSQAWLNAHPRFFSDANYQTIALSADRMARAKGIEADSDEYFEFIETMTGDRTPSEMTEEAPQQRQPARSSSTAAPVSRTSAVKTPAKVVRLTPEQRAMADDIMSQRYPDPNERYKAYAANLQRMVDSGNVMSG